MSGYILCQTKRAKLPYFIENISTNVYSIEELCYYLYHNLYLIDQTIMNEGLCSWIQEELELPALAAKLRSKISKFASAEDIVYPVFKEINYLTYEELKELNVRLQKMNEETDNCKHSQDCGTLFLSSPHGFPQDLPFPEDSGKPVSHVHTFHSPLMHLPSVSHALPEFLHSSSADVHSVLSVLHMSDN